MRSFELREEISLTNQQLNIYKWLREQPVSELKQQTLYDILTVVGIAMGEEGKTPPTEEGVALVCAIVEHIYDFRFKELSVGPHSNKIMQQARDKFDSLLVK
ncbi:MAG: hypothetical protein ABS904_00475 [Solibacillus isronensis]